MNKEDYLKGFEQTEVNDIGELMIASGAVFGLLGTMAASWLMGGIAVLLFFVAYILKKQ